MKLILLAAIILLTVACASEQEEIQANQRKHCKEEIMAGKQPTEFCLAVLPEYRNVVPAQQMAVAPAVQEQVQPQQMYAPQATPVVVQSPAHQDSTLQNMLLGGVIGHAIGSSNSQPAVAPAPQYAAPRYVQPPRSSITKNITINQAPIVATKPAVKSSMDMSKLSSYGARPSTSSSRRK